MKAVNRHKIKQTKGEVAYLKPKNCNFLLELNYYDIDSPYSSQYVVEEGLDHLPSRLITSTKPLKAKLSGYPTVLEIKQKILDGPI